MCNFDLITIIFMFREFLISYYCYISFLYSILRLRFFSGANKNSSNEANLRIFTPGDCLSYLVFYSTWEVENNRQIILQNVNLHSPDNAHFTCCCREEHMGIFLHTLIFHVLSEFKLAFYSFDFPVFYGALEHFDTAYLRKKKIF